MFTSFAELAVSGRFKREMACSVYRVRLTCKSYPGFVDVIINLVVQVGLGLEEDSTSDIHYYLKHSWTTQEGLYSVL